MEMNYIDILVSIIQNAVFIYMIYFCLDISKKGNEKKIVLCLTILSFNVIVLPRVSQSILGSIFLTHIFALILIYMFFEKQYTKAFVAYSLIYSIVAVWLFVFGNLLYGILEQFVPTNYMIVTTNILMYGSQFVLFFLCYKIRIKIKQIYKVLSYEHIDSNYTIMLSFIPDFLISFYFTSYNLDNTVFRNIVTAALVVFLGFVILLFGRVIKKANYINKLNKTLTNKNDELKEIKHDYGLQMECLFELSDMGKFNDVVNLLKSIINNQNNAHIIDNSANASSLLSLATRHITSDNINIVLEDKANYKLATITEMELYRIIINIVNNAVKAMKNEGTLVAKSFEDLKSIIIVIENDGEKIPEENIDKIFNAGFTTKNNIEKNHGYGLSIVKDLLKNYDGNIFVESNDIITKFTITLPKKNCA